MLKLLYSKQKYLHCDWTELGKNLCDIQHWILIWIILFGWFLWKTEALNYAFHVGVTFALFLLLVT